MWVASVVYPRWRGEHEKSGVKSIPAGGLSPLARGTQRAEKRPRFLVRFIPAGAGNTPPRKPITFMESVYPRWRGEHSRPRSTATDPIGLSPLARGTPGRLPRPRAHDRFIPAGAGNTGGAHVVPEHLAVYPRWRGEHGITISNVSQHLGLSPLARGTPAPPRAKQCRLRFIPAGAGNTSPQSLTGCCVSVYPRWRGEHPPLSPLTWCGYGLSPLARGTPALHCQLLQETRFIPAGAGNTLKIYYCFIIAF